MLILAGLAVGVLAVTTALWYVVCEHRRFRLPTAPVSGIRPQDNYVSIWFRANGRDHDLYLFADGSVLYDDASRSVAYVLDSDAEDAFRALVNVILRYGTKR